MRKISTLAAFAAFAAVATLLPSVGASQQMPASGMPSLAIRWESNLENAKRLATQTGRPVLIYFCGSSCVYCRRMENEVLNQPAVIAEVNADYVPVNINADRFPTTARQYRIANLPTTIIVSPQGQVLDFKEGYVAVNEYAARLNQVAANARRTQETMVAQIPAGAVPPSSQPAMNPQIVNPQMVNPQMANPPAAAPTQQAYVAKPYAASVATGPIYASQGQTAPVVPQQPRPPMDVPQPSVGMPTLALDGFCPVTLCEKQQWVPGNKQWGANHRGRIYLFAGPEEQRRFLNNPDRYAPVASGNDIVLATEQGQAVPGTRQYGYYCGGRVYLFSSPTTMQKFQSNPSVYTRQADETYRASANPNQQWR
jgi:protein disulfide-isomerase